MKLIVAFRSFAKAPNKNNTKIIHKKLAQAGRIVDFYLLGRNKINATIIRRKLVQAITFLTCTSDIHGSNLGTKCDLYLWEMDGSSLGTKYDLYGKCKVRVSVQTAPCIWKAHGRNLCTK
jgi:hypothetical protein